MWSTDFFKDRKGQVERLVTLINKCPHPHPPPLDEFETCAGNESFSASVGEQAGTVEPHTNVPNGNYREPSAVPYVFAKGERTFSGQDILTARADTLRRAVAYVIKVEAPIHLDDLMARVVGLWDTKAGRRIAAHIAGVVNQLEREGVVQRRESFYWAPDTKCVVRSRIGTNISGGAHRIRGVRWPFGMCFPRGALLRAASWLLAYGQYSGSAGQARYSKWRLARRSTECCRTALLGRSARALGCGLWRMGKLKSNTNSDTRRATCLCRMGRPGRVDHASGCRGIGRIIWTTTSGYSG